jgi:hypothetical protein
MWASGLPSLDRCSVLDTADDAVLGYGLTGSPASPESTIYLYSQKRGSLKLARNYGRRDERFGE